MQDNLEVFFCDLCNTSVALPDLETGLAQRVKGKVVGPCCLAELRGGAADRAEASPSRAGLLTVALVVLAGVAGSALFLDWRVSEESNLLQGRLGGLGERVREQQERLPRIEARLADSSVVSDLAQLREEWRQTARNAADGQAGLQQAVEQAVARCDQIERHLVQLSEAHGENASGLRSLADDVRRLAGEFAMAMAEPRPVPVAATSAPPADDQVADAGTGKAAPTILPEIVAQIERLADPNPGTRFEAVDQLVRSKDPAALEPLLRMIKDADLFVRRLTVEGLAEFRAAATVDALIDALGDDEKFVRETTLASLRRLTGQDIEFDAAARPDERRAAQRRWQQWWEKNRAAF